MDPQVTIIHETETNWGRQGIIKLIDNRVYYDCSDGEYGPVEFDLDILLTALNAHKNKIHNETKKH